MNLPAEADKILRETGPYSNAGYALRFAASFPRVCMVLSGMSDMAQVRDNVKTMADFVPFAPAEHEAVKKVCAVFRAADLIPCTGCRYCVLDNDCPKDIRIPDLLAARNRYETFHDWNAKFYYDIVTHGRGQAGSCIGCGKCENICPQHLPIRKLLKEISEVFD